jgi:hypothetical protein
MERSIRFTPSPGTPGEGRGEGRGEGVFTLFDQPLAFFKKRLKDRIRVPENVIVQKTNDMLPIKLDSRRPPVVVRSTISMRFPTQFYDKPRLRAVKVGNISIDAMLPAKLRPAELAIAKKSPELLLGGRGIFAHRAGALEK